MSGSHGCIDLCQSSDLVDSALAVPFDVTYQGQTCRAFAIRYQGHIHAYLNRCSHVPMEMDYQPDRFFDQSGQWLICATHGAMYAPDSGYCVQGPCRGARLEPVAVIERDGGVFLKDDND